MAVLQFPWTWVINIFIYGLRILEAGSCLLKNFVFDFFLGRALNYFCTFFSKFCQIKKFEIEHEGFQDTRCSFHNPKTVGKSIEHHRRSYRSSGKTSLCEIYTNSPCNNNTPVRAVYPPIFIRFHKTNIFGNKAGVDTYNLTPTSLVFYQNLRTPICAQKFQMAWHRP